MNAAELMDKVVDVYKKSFWKQIAFAAIVYTIAIVAFFVLTFALAIIISFVVVIAMVGGGEEASFAVLVVAGLIVLPLILLWQAFSSSGHILLSRQAFYGHRVQLSHMGIFKVFLRVFTAILAQIVFAIPFIALVIGVVVVFANTIQNFFFMVDVSAAEVVGFFALILLLGIGYVVYSHLFSLSVAVAVFERRYFFDTIKRSFQLVKPEFWSILGIRVIWYFVGVGISFTAQGAFSLILMGWEMVADTVPMGFGITILLSLLTGSVGSALVLLVIAPLDGIMQSLIYFNQRMKTEGLDIEIRLEKLAQQVNR